MKGMASFSRALYRVLLAPSAIARKLVLTPIVSHSFRRCGKSFSMGKNNDFRGIENISVGNCVSFGPDQRIWTTNAQVIIGDDVMFGPRVTIVSGDHRVDIPGKPMREVLPSEKLPENDQDVVIGNDCWIGANVTILKGVVVAPGSVVAAGALVTKDLDEPNCIWGGVPARLLKRRFDHGR